MEIRYVSLKGRGATDACLMQAVRQMRAAGLRLAGTVAVDSAPDDPLCCMELQVLPDGPLIRINQNLGKDATGCKLDGGALEQAVMEAETRADQAQLLVVNKFGKLESTGRGYVPLISAALGRGCPVLIGVNDQNLADLLAFVGDMATPLPGDPDLIADWALALA